MNDFQQRLAALKVEGDFLRSWRDELDFTLKLPLQPEQHSQLNAEFQKLRAQGRSWRGRVAEILSAG